MSVILEIRRRGRHVAGSILGALVFAYFLFHAVQGDRGVLAWMQVQQQIAEVETQLSGIRAERDWWERRTALLRSDGLDPDLLEERVRVVTGLARNDEFIIIDAQAAANAR
jgi:cell division protein FtsB